MTAIVYPDRPLAPEELDRYLTTGWRPTGQHVYISDFLRTEDDELHGCVQLRVPLADFTFKKRQRKLLNRNAQRFTYKIEPLYAIDEEIRRVNRAYLREHPEKSREDIEFQLFTTDGLRALDTWIVRIYEGRALVGFSLFDLGRKTLYSKAGVYDPEYRAHSLGRYTMLLEVDFAWEQGVTHYHPGYFSPTEPCFDYKLSLGPTEYRDVVDQSWKPLPAPDGTGVTDPLAYVRERLLAAREKLSGSGYSRVYFHEYVSYTANFSLPGGDFLDAPLLLQLEDEWGGYCVLVYNLDDHVFELRRPTWSGAVDMRRKNVSAAGVARLRSVLREGELLARTSSLEKLPGIVRQYT